MNDKLSNQLMSNVCICKTRNQVWLNFQAIQRKVECSYMSLHTLSSNWLFTFNAAIFADWLITSVSPLYPFQNLEIIHLYSFFSQSMIQYRAWPHDLAPGNSDPNVAGSSAPAYEPDQTQYTAASSLPSQIGEDRICHVRRGLDSQLLEQLDEGEFRPIDHVFFIVHGIGDKYNLRRQGLIECVNDMR